MAIVPSRMSQQDENNNNNHHEEDEEADDHEHDVVMPGFRFHPTEEELVEFYLRRKVEGKSFNVDLITFLDLYRYDPWELPAMAAIGEKEWYFYVPRDRKYRNGDRPNRVTTSGYWKATGADRMIRSENFRSIGLKKTLVFYTGKAPKGIRTSWIMNEYRLPHHETERLQKAEISLCRVYKRAGGTGDHPPLPRCLPATRASSSSTCSTMKQYQPSISLSPFDQFPARTSAAIPPPPPLMAPSEEEKLLLFQHPNKAAALSSSSSPSSSMFSGGSFSTPSVPSFSAAVDDLHRLVNLHQLLPLQHFHHHTQLLPLQPQPPQTLPVSTAAAAFSDRLWDWSSLGAPPSPEPNKDYGAPSNPFK